LHGDTPNRPNGILSLDITDRKRTEEELLNLTHQVSDLNASLERKVEQRTHQLQVANKELEAFSYSVSHDLRAPLRAINGYARMLEEDYGHTLDHDGKRLLTTVQKNAIQMGSLIDDLLAFSRLGRKDVQKTKINMAVMVKNVADELMIEMKTHPHVTINISSYAVADSTLIRQVWINFIANAIKYSSKKEDPKIEIQEQVEDDRIIYSVKDNGIGFDMAYAHKLFGVFQRLHSAEEFEGTGVGLAIIKRIIDKHGGTVWAQSERNQGATFFFALPSQQYLNKIDNHSYLD
jgi:light-regulated signal transduction histidine kinase (bacteriophytochrome)